MSRWGKVKYTVAKNNMNSNKLFPLYRRKKGFRSHKRKRVIRLSLKHTDKQQHSVITKSIPGHNDQPLTFLSQYEADKKKIKARRRGKVVVIALLIFVLMFYFIKYINQLYLQPAVQQINERLEQKLMNLYSDPLVIEQAIVMIESKPSNTLTEPLTLTLINEINRWKGEADNQLTLKMTKLNIFPLLLPLEYHSLRITELAISSKGYRYENQNQLDVWNITVELQYEIPLLRFHINQSLITTMPFMYSLTTPQQSVYYYDSEGNSVDRYLQYAPDLPRNLNRP